MSATLASNLHSRSPSPAPPLPKTLTPGVRATTLQKVFDQALAHTISTCSYPNFSACFPTPARHNRTLLESVWGQITTMIQDKSKKEFEDILVERELVSGLNELERLIGEAKAKKEKGGKAELPSEPPHTLPPQQLYLAHLAPYLATTQTQLETELSQLQAENEHLGKDLVGQRDDVETLLNGLEAVIADLEAANGVMEEAEGEAIQSEAKDVDGEISSRQRESRL